MTHSNETPGHLSNWTLPSSACATLRNISSERSSYTWTTTAKQKIFLRNATRNRETIEAKKIRFLSTRVKKKKRNKKKRGKKNLNPEPSRSHSALQASYLFYFTVFIDAGDDAPPQKKPHTCYYEATLKQLAHLQHECHEQFSTLKSSQPQFLDRKETPRLLPTSSPARGPKT